MRPSTPPASLTRLNAVSMPSFIWRPSSRAEPEKAAAMPKRISRSVMPRTAGPGAAGTVLAGAVAANAGPGAGAGAGTVLVVAGAGAALAGAGPITADRLGPAIDRSRSASWRSAARQSV